jgi:hypothetical protein
MGPEAGPAGGHLVAEGTPAEVAKAGTVTGRFLAQVDNLRLNEDGKGWKPVKGMMKQITEIHWPDGDVHLAGLKF